MKPFINSKPAALAVLVTVSVSVYFNILFNGFVYDDHYMVIGNEWIRDSRFIPRILFSSEWSFLPGSPTVNYFRPTFHLLAMADYYIFGLSPWGFHLTSILLHTLNTVLVFLLAVRLLGEKNGVLLGFLSGILFAVHPIHSEPVAWVSAVSDLIYSFFLLCAFYIYIRRPSGVSAYLLSPAVFFMALISKETAVVMAVFLFLYDYIVRKEPLSPLAPWIKRYLPYATAAVLYLILRLYALGALAPETVRYTSLTPYQGIINIFPLIPMYLFKLLLPINLNIFHSLRPIDSILELRGILAVLFVTSLTVLIIWLRNKRPLLVFLLLWIMLPLIPALYIPGLGREVFAERYLYLPSAGFVVLVAMGFVHLFKRVESRVEKSVFVVLAVTIIGIYSFVTIDRTFAWRSDYTIWLDASKKSPDSGYVHLNLGNAYKGMGLIKEATGEYEAAIGLGLLTEDRWTASYNLGIAYVERDLYDRAVSMYKEALKIKPYNVNTLNNLGLAYEKKGLLDESIVQFEKALEGSPLDHTIHKNLGRVYRKKGFYDKAMNEYKEAVRINPDDAESRNSLGALYSMQGRFKEAIVEFKEALRINPDFAAARKNLKKVMEMSR